MDPLDAFMAAEVRLGSSPAGQLTRIERLPVLRSLWVERQTRRQRAGCSHEVQQAGAE